MINFVQALELVFMFFGIICGLVFTRAMDTF